MCANVESLEARQLLAGNVTTSLINGHLVITGDAQNNRIVVSGENGPAGTVIVQAADHTTQVNGEFQAIVQGVTGSVRIALGAKADHVLVQGLNLAGGLTIDGGRHGDAVSVVGSRIGGALRVDGQDGDDTIVVLSSRVLGSTSLNGQAGADVLNLDLSRFDGALRARGGGGDDVFAFDSSTFNGGRTIDGQAGNDRIVSGVEVKTNFARGKSLGWQAGFADYPQGEEEFFELESGLRSLPAELGSGKGFLLSGNNHSDDLFMFLKRRLGTAQGLKANTSYLARFEIKFGSNVPSGCGGIGGAPAESVYLKAGASAREPGRVVDEENHYRMTIDKGNQSQSGADASNVGNIANGQECEAAGADPDYKSVTKTHVHTARVKTDAQGNLWVIVGVDSGFEGTTALYIQAVNVRLVEVG